MKKRRIVMVTIMGIILATAVVLGWQTTRGTSSDMGNEGETLLTQQPVGPAFSADSAYAYIQARYNFGLYTMNNEAHGQCANWITRKFQQFGCDVITQRTDVEGHDGTTLHATNIMTKYKPEATECILLCVHWGSCPWANSDPDSTNWCKPVMTASDGASGIAVMLELARPLRNNATLAYGIDFVCFDAEDWGTPQWEEQSGSKDSWALGVQYWTKNASHDNRPEYGILLDVVGEQGARFYQELASKQYAPNIVEKVWTAAEAIGYGSCFPRQDGGYIADDHIPVNEHTKILTINIIPFYPDYPQSSFDPAWHTIHNTVEHIDKSVLKAVRQTVARVLLSEE